MENIQLDYGMRVKKINSFFHRQKCRCMLKYVYRIEGGCMKNKSYYKSLFYVFLMVIYGILTYVFLWVGFNTKTKIRVDYQDIGDVYYDVKYVDDNYKNTNSSSMR